ncbi:glycosyltransferase family 4 protein [Leptolyngbya sp. CCY15150]|uniref:glycosyltransferase family 4 protein n=1 Tax=Leptolyngbya sp. CCY15150 TaxID=2767772 RepID=UPI00194DEFB2|nr:glycosyltransferase family 4 protein [Leptolyngbya sp. CCY15150]
MNIVVIADARLPVPPQHYGGTERIVAMVCRGLQQRGHHVTLLAHPDSTEGDRLIPHQPPTQAYASRAYRKLWFQGLSLAAIHKADVVYNFGRVDYLWAALKTSVPVIARFANDIRETDLRWLLQQRSQALALISISDDQRRHVSHLGNWTTVYNGVEGDRFPFTSRPAHPGYLAFLGRLTHNKGVHLAIQVAQKTGLPLKIAGNISDEPGGRQYFETQVQPYLSDTIEWVGVVDDAQKVSFLGNAKALLFPIQWHEPFGIVMAEALSCGTPVIATRWGSAPEVIAHGRTGFLCNDVEDMVQAVQQIDRIDRAHCRSECDRRFSHDRMVDGYLQVYHRLVQDPRCLPPPSSWMGKRDSTPS